MANTTVSKLAAMVLTEPVPTVKTSKIQAVLLVAEEPFIPETNTRVSQLRAMVLTEELSRTRLSQIQAMVLKSEQAIVIAPAARNALFVNQV